ncbi:MAG: HlyD family efflux transporter periplasmic adaptor subunit, partial [Planctomycetales bacterium]|nr:HlyD family efflux transporter periplasmic adaptor subunit [Planctomycetales bacterium]
SYEISKYNNELVLGTLLPRQDVRLKESQRTVELALERAKLASELDLNRARYELEQARIQRRKDNEKHAELVEDKGLLSIRSPCAGVVYYGRCVDGKWGEINSLKQKMLPEKTVPKGAVMMTIVDPSKMHVLGSVGEDEMPNVKVGQETKLETKAEGVEPIDARVASVESIPEGGGKFGLEIEITGDCPEWLVPGMTGKAKITTYRKKDALLAPTDAVHTDEDSEREYVWVVEEEDGKVEVEKQWVKTGRSKGKEVEILDGVKAGDVLSLDPDEKGTENKEDADHEEETDGDD